MRQLWDLSLSNLYVPRGDEVHGVPIGPWSATGGTVVTRRLVLFDIDGTLLLSGGAGRRAILAALTEDAGIAPDQVDQVRFDGKTDPQIVTELFAAAGHPERPSPERIARVLDRYLEHLERDLAQFADRATVMPGVEDLLESLGQDDRVVVGLLTGNVTRGAVLKLAAVKIRADQFRVGAYGSDHHLRSELPAIAVGRAQVLFGRLPAGDEIIIIGDTPADVTCGRGVGARSIGVATGSFSTESLAGAGADHVFADLSATATVHAAILGTA